MKVLFLAYYFPPESSSGSFRPLFFVNHLSELGVDIHVLTARREDYLAEQPVDENLMLSLDKRVRVTRSSVVRPREALLRFRDRFFPREKERVGRLKVATGENSVPATKQDWRQAFKDTVTDLLATPDPQVGWIPSSFAAGRRIIRRERPDLIIATGSPWSGLLSGLILKKVSRCPLVLDFRDPWVSNPNFAQKGRLARRIDRFLEKAIVRNADLIVANTKRLQEDFIFRYPDLPGQRVITVTNGFEDYLPSPPGKSAPCLTITHTGALYFSRNPAALLEAVKELIESGLIARDEVRLQFVGGIQVVDSNVKELLDSRALEGVVEIIPRVSYQESLDYMTQSHVLLLIQPDFPMQIPRKLYEYMAARKPLFCITEPHGATGEIVTDYNLGYVCDNLKEDIRETFLRMSRDWKNGELPQRAAQGCDSFLNKELAAKLLCSFQSLGGSP